MTADVKLLERGGMTRKGYKMTTAAQSDNKKI